MAIVSELAETHYQIRLEHEIDITAAGEFRQSLIDGLLSGKEVQVDMSAVSDLDITAMQLLWAAARECENKGGAFILTGHLAENIQCAFRDAGFDNFPQAGSARTKQVDNPANREQSE